MYLYNNNNRCSVLPSSLKFVRCYSKFVVRALRGCGLTTSKLMHELYVRQVILGFLVDVMRTASSQREGHILNRGNSIVSMAFTVNGRPVRRPSGGNSLMEMTKATDNVAMDTVAAETDRHWQFISAVSTARCRIITGAALPSTVHCSSMFTTWTSV